MRLSYTVLFAIAAVVACVDSSLVATESTMVNPNLELNRAGMDGVHDIRGTRLLRAETSTDNSNEERVSNWITKITNLLKPKNSAKGFPVGEKVTIILNKKLQKQVAKLMKSRHPTTDNAFTLAKLNNNLNGKELFKPDRLPMYISFSERTFGQRGIDKWGIETLLKHFPEQELARIANIGFRNGDDLSKQTAEGLRSGLISKWLNEKKPAKDVAQLLKGGQPTMEKFNSEAYVSYMNSFNNKYITNAVA